MSLVKFNKIFAHMDVLCVKRYLDFTLAGIGSDLFVYSNDGVLQWSQEVFTNERIHSIYVKNNMILLKGGRQICLIKFKENSSVWNLVSKIQCSDWVMDFILFENQLVGLVTAHNFFEYWDLGIGKQLNNCCCEEKCILYSCKIIGDSLGDLVILAGTVFGDVVIWTPIFEDVILQRFKAHNGAVFSIEVKPIQKIITTTSDDRSLKIWSIITQTSLNKPSDWKNSIQLIHTLFGHTARVWKSLILNNYFLTIGEDSQLIVWRDDGKMSKTLTLHQECGIRALDYSKESNFITTAGEDGGINTFSLKHLLLENEPVKVLNECCSKVCYTQNEIVYCKNGSCVLVSESSEDVIYKNDNFSSYCILEVGGEFILMGSIKGHLVVINSKTRVVLHDEKILNGRVYSIHWLDSILVTCGPEGQLDLWDVTDKCLKNIGRKLLPNCKERWTTCGIVCNYLILGDRMGNIHVYEINGGVNPLKSFKKIHSHLGVTGLSVIDSIWVSIGRDGTIKEFNELNYLTSSKLPMEWPWKIVRYNEDILILGFHSVFFIIWSVKNREVIGSHNCGGGHRFCDYKIKNNKISFLYVKEKNVFVVDLKLDKIKRIRYGFHGKEINCVKIINKNPLVIVTGSEDTTLRFSKIENFELKHVEVLKSHISSIRGLWAEPTKVISVGGKGQIIIWDINPGILKSKVLVNHRLINERKNLKYNNGLTDPEIRIMCVDVLKLNNEFIIAIGCSDCKIRIFTQDVIFREVCVILYTHCILNVVFIKNGILISMGTDGKVVFWNLDDIYNVKRLLEYSLHQSGINSFALEKIKPEKYILATGGDDNLISVTILEVLGGDINIKRVWENKTSHSCQITGIKILNNYILTTSIDQRITVWKYIINEDFKIEYLHQHITSVPDIQGMDAVWFDNSILTIIYGKGIEIYNINIDN